MEVLTYIGRRQSGRTFRLIQDLKRSQESAADTYTLVLCRPQDIQRYGDSSNVTVNDLSTTNFDNVLQNLCFALKPGKHVHLVLDDVLNDINDNGMVALRYLRRFSYVHLYIAAQRGDNGVDVTRGLASTLARI